MNDGAHYQRASGSKVLVAAGVYCCPVVQVLIWVNCGASVGGVRRKSAWPCFPA